MLFFQLAQIVILLFLLFLAFLVVLLALLVRLILARRLPRLLQELLESLGHTIIVLLLLGQEYSLGLLQKTMLYSTNIIDGRVWNELLLIWRMH